MYKRNKSSLWQVDNSCALSDMPAFLTAVLQMWLQLKPFINQSWTIVTLKWTLMEN